MKGTLIGFKKRVSKTIEKVYKLYKGDFQSSLGSLINEKNVVKERKYSHSVKDSEKEL